MNWLQRRIVDRQVVSLAIAGALALNQLRVALTNWGITLWRPGFADFGNYYLYARVGLHQGWTRLYDTAAQQQEWLRLGGQSVIPWFPIIYPPPLAWMVVPFTLLPLPLAFACWSALLVGCLLLTWRLLAPRQPRLVRWTVLAGVLAIAAVPYALLLGQILILELVAIAATWWLLTKGRDGLAGLAMLALVFKPQIAILLPLVLLVIGRWRALAVWLTGSAAIGAIAVFTTGPPGLREYVARLGDAAAAAPQYLVPTQLTIAGFLGRGLLTLAVVGALAVATLIAAHRNRRSGPALAVGCALVGSMAITPYLHSQDLATLLLAGGIAWQAGLDAGRRWVLAAGYVLLLAISYWSSGSVGAVLGAMLLAAEAAWLLAAAIAPLSCGRSDQLSTFAEIPLDRTA